MHDLNVAMLPTRFVKHLGLSEHAEALTGEFAMLVAAAAHESEMFSR